MDIYTDLTKVTQPPVLVVPPTVEINFADGAYVEIKEGAGEYDVRISALGKPIYNTKLSVNQFARTSLKYFLPYEITIYQGGVEVFNYSLNLEGENVMIEFCSSSLGDTIAWIPYVDEFRLKHNCNVYVSTFLNDLFENVYTELKFIKPGGRVNNIFAWYKLGWFYDGDKVDRTKNPLDPKGEPLQKTACDILGLSFTSEIPADIDTSKVPEIDTPEKYVCIGIHSTSQAKYWNNPTGWQELTDWFKSKGFEVILLSKEPDGFNGNHHPKGITYPSSFDMMTTIAYLQKAKLFIGVSSGLSWLSWILGTPTALISGFTEEYTEMWNCIRISPPEGKCRGCFNWIKLQDENGWNWCPRYFNTERQFECTKSIDFQSIKDRLEIFLKI